MFTQKLAAGGQITAPVIAASPNTYDCDVTQTVMFMGDPV